MTVPATHYPTPAAKCADIVVHAVGLAFALFGGGVLIGLACGLGSIVQTASISVYVAGFVGMLALSAVYNFAKAQWRPLLRRFDHAGIFLMIAGSYTPFTTLRLHGAWAVWMTASVWSLATLGIVGKLVLPGIGRKLWVALYLALGWLVLVAIKPMIDRVSLAALLLLAIGGIVYSTGAAFYVMKRLRFRRAIWHGHVVVGSALHYVAVLVGVVLTPWYR